MLEVREGVQCTPCTMIERGNFEPLSPKKDFDFKDFDFNVLKLILTLRSITAGLIWQRVRRHILKKGLKDFDFNVFNVFMF
ncbi:MAG: hypothetical protein LBU70_08570 [Chitinispirillales bacterium]|jgi:hypothetical protein|nr:hypothetical protein [Chitinispirillales bacterium]